MNRRALLAVPTILAAIRCALFLLQGGFGGGHGSFDLIIWIVGLPATLITTFLPVWPGDFLALVLLPAVLNLGAWAALLGVWGRWHKARRA